MEFLNHRRNLRSNLDLFSSNNFNTWSPSLFTLELHEFELINTRQFANDNDMNALFTKSIYY